MKKLLWIIPVAALAVALVFMFIPTTLTAAEEEEMDLLHSSERGCTSCHRVVERNGQTFDYTLYAEVKNLPEHPSIKKERVEEEGVLYCLICHEDMGEKSFKKLLHPIHYFSEHFHGNCFSCHDISDEGEFVLWDQVHQGS